MTDIVIVEDEAVAAAHLKRLLAAEMPDARVTAVLQSIEECVEYFGPDADKGPKETTSLLFMDIHLADGPAFKIFEQVEIPCPIIFTTAYDQYALQAFRVNSIDYLLKPISQSDLHRALAKLERFNRADIAAFAASMQPREASYKSTFLIPCGGKLLPLRVDDIACICLDEGTTRVLMATDAPPVSLDTPLDTLMDRLDPDRFYRANRQYIVAHDSIREISVWPIGKLALTLNVATPTRIIVSKAKVPDFKKWYTK